jgi:hypothetical protein
MGRGVPVYITGVTGALPVTHAFLLKLATEPTRPAGRRIQSPADAALRDMMGQIRDDETTDARHRGGPLGGKEPEWRNLQSSNLQ